MSAGFGFLLGVLFDVIYFLKLLVKRNIIISNIFNFLFALCYGLVVLLITINFNMGQFRLFVLIGFLIGTIFEHKTLGKLFAKMFLWLYNKLCKACCALQKTKLVKKILK